MAARFGAASRVARYRRMLTWTMRPDIRVAPWPNDVLERRYVEIGARQP